MDIEDLYRLLPEFACTPGCIECCRNFGVPSRTRVEDERIQHYLRKTGLPGPRQARDNCCPYVTEQGCSIYPVRPLICRLYGTSPNYLCKNGVRPIQLLHEDQEMELFDFYQRNFFDPEE